MILIKRLWWEIGKQYDQDYQNKRQDSCREQKYEEDSHSLKKSKGYLTIMRIHHIFFSTVMPSSESAFFRT